MSTHKEPRRSHRHPTGTKGSELWRNDLAAIAPLLASLPINESSARLLHTHGRLSAACEAYRDLIAREPRNLSALRSYVQILRLVGKGDECARMRRYALGVETTNLGLEGSGAREAADFLFAAEGGCPVPGAMPSAYVARCFDLYEDFDVHLVERLNYRAPAVLRQAVRPQLEAPSKALRIFDLGCGTGLAGICFQDYARRLDGVDLSPRMIERASARGIYDHLHTGDVVEALRAASLDYHLLVAADICPYIGDLGPLFGAARTAVEPHGILCMTTEAHDGEEYALDGRRRFAHSRSYLLSTGASRGWSVACHQDSVRTEHGQAVACWVVVATAI